MQTKERKASIVILICIGLIILIILLGSMGVVLFGEEKTAHLGHPCDPTIVIDSQNNVHIIWEAGYSEEFPTSMTHYMKLSSSGDILINNTGLCGYRSKPSANIDSSDNIHIVFYYARYLKIDTNGTLLANKRLLVSQGDNVDFNLAIDNENIIHIVWLDSRNDPEPEIYPLVYDTYYAKLDNNGSLLMDEIRLSSSSTSVQTGSDSGGLPTMVIDSKNNIHVTWTDTRCGVSYSMLDNNGTILRDQWQITNLTENNTAIRNSCLLIDSNDNLYFFYEKYPLDRHGYALSFYGEPPKGTYVKKIDSNGTTIFEKQINTQVIGDGVVYSDDSIGIVGSGYLTGFDTEINVIGGPVKLNHSLSEFDIDVTIDSNDNVHIVGFEMRGYLEWEGRTYSTIWYYTVYYSKWDKDLNPLINEMAIDTDGEYEEPKREPPIVLIIIIILVIIILITMIWAAMILVKG